MQEHASAQAFIYAEAIRRSTPAKYKVLNVLFKDGSKSAPEKTFEVDDDFNSLALDQYLAEVLLLKPYVKLATEWDQKLQSMADNKIDT